MNISILYGGDSAERKISMQTGLAVAGAIHKNYSLDLINPSENYLSLPNRLLGSDLVFNALHGGNGENGNIQSFLEIYNFNYTGSGSKASKIAMDKHITKMLAKSNGINTPNWILIKYKKDISMSLENKESKKFSYPYIVKPSNEGSTFGLTLVENEKELEGAIELAAKFSNEILIEEYIEGRELTVSILGNKPLPIVEIKPKNKIYDFECKYTSGMTDYIVPADISDSLTREISNEAVSIFKAIGCRHYGRVDFRLDKDNNPFLLEVNTLPGLTEHSLFPKAAEIAGLSFTDLIDTIIGIARLDNG